MFNLVQQGIPYNINNSWFVNVLDTVSNTQYSVPFDMPDSLDPDGTLQSANIACAINRYQDYLIANSTTPEG